MDLFQALAGFAVKRWPLVVVGALAFCAFAWERFQHMPIQAFPDVTDPMVDVIGLYPGQSAEEVERRVTVELERVLAGTPHLIDLRSVSVFGLSLVTMTFEEGQSDFELRTMVGERLRSAALPSGATAEMGPQSTPVGQIYRYTLKGPRSLRDLRAIQDFVVERRLRAVQGVAEVVTFGGFERNYQLRIDPFRLAGLGVSVNEVYDAVSRSNDNAGGGYVGIGGQEFVVRGVGALRDPKELGEAVIRTHDGVPLRVGDVADVVEGSSSRRGSVGRGYNDEVVEGIVLLQRGRNPNETLERLHARIKQLNDDILPKDVKIGAFYDRGDLLKATLATVGRNLLEGALLVFFVVYAFLNTARAALIVVAVIPCAMLSAFLGLYMIGLPANLISLGAVDFGILVDGAVLVVEAALHAFEHGGGRPTKQLLQDSAAFVAQPVLFSMLIIIVALAPIFMLERVEGRIFAPMAYTYVFALIGALVSALLLTPALLAMLMRGEVKISEPRWIIFLRGGYLAVLRALDRRRVASALLFIPAALGLAWFASDIGTEFLPELNEGGFYITTVFPSTIALDETRGQVRRMRELILETPEVVDVLSHIGRPEEAPQAEGPNNAEFFVVLAPEGSWRPGYDKRRLESELREKVARIPGAAHNFSQPIADRVFETISGVIGQVVVKVRGSDLAAMTKLAEEIRGRLAGVQGVADLALYQAGVVPALRIDLKRDRLARRGLSVDDVQETIRIALGGLHATEFWDGEQRFSVTLKLPEALRANPEALGRLVVGKADARVTLAELADVESTQGRASIWRQDFARFVAVKFNVRGRDLGGTVDAAKAAVADLKIPEGVYLDWGGEFKNQERAMRRLGLTLPVALAAIIGLLYLNFRDWRPTLAIFLFLPVSTASAAAGLKLLGENFSVSSAVGCIALLGQVVLSGVVLCARIDSARRGGQTNPLFRGASDAFRPLLLTTALAAFGLIPAAMSHSMGSETQRPFAISIVAGLVISTPAILFILPLVYAMLQGLPRAEEGGHSAVRGGPHPAGPAHASASAQPHAKHDVPSSSAPSSTTAEAAAQPPHPTDPAKSPPRPGGEILDS